MVTRSPDVNEAAMGFMMGKLSKDKASCSQRQPLREETWTVSRVKCERFIGQECERTGPFKEPWPLSVATVCLEHVAGHVAGHSAGGDEGQR